jgi:hypothetical protein
MRVADRAFQASAEFEIILAEVFRKAGWRIQPVPRVGDMEADLIVDAGRRKYVVELKVSSEGRRDRLVPLLSQAILQAQTVARRLPEPAVPVAVVAAKRIPESVAEHLKLFAKRHAPEAGVGVIDAEGLRSFAGPGLDGLDAKPPRRMASHISSAQRLPDLFSDLNQWMLKILLGQRLPELLISAPREPLRNSSQLAEAANVSVMSASRFVKQLANWGFLDESEKQLQIVRVEELLDLWISASREGVKEIPARWIIKGGQQQLHSALREYASTDASGPAVNRKRGHGNIIKVPPPRCCVGLFGAADALGLGFVHGVTPQIYLDRLTLDSLNRLGLLVDDSNRATDVYIRIPVDQESVFRALVTRKGVPVSDVLQVWLDVSAHPARGREQAEEIKRRVLKPLFGKQR